MFLAVHDIFEVGVDVGSFVFAMADVFICRKVVIVSLPNSEKERVAKSKIPADSNLLNVIQDC